MKSVLLIGLGRFGRHVAEKLNEIGNEVLAIDQNPERVQAVLPIVTNALIGDSTNPDFLRSVGASNFDVCIVAIGDHFQNSLETTSLLKELGAPFVVARASQDRHAKFLLNNGADDIVFPEAQLAAWTALRYSANHILDYIEVDKDYGIFEIAVPSGWKGKTIGTLNIRKKYKINILGIRESGQLNMNITPDSGFESAQSMLVLGRSAEIQKTFHIY